MKTITEDEYDEWQQLRQNALIQSKFDSVKQLKSLKEDIDVPVRKLVAMFALLGCEPLFSCCGFDYDGQPLHKTHEYGCVYFQLKDNYRTVQILHELVEAKIVYDHDEETSKWQRWKIKDTWFLRSAFTREHDKIDYPWVSDRTCIHYSEIAVLRIDLLEKTLLNGINRFADVVVLSDTNGVYKDEQKISHWQYPGLEPWIIRKDEISPQL
ncbi:MAG: hypothetical protein ACW98K_15620 [Candidatus Kariarchaeaceae archaeon]|jgi:hypothetical protein